jgi:hypothetical protein
MNPMEGVKKIAEQERETLEIVLKEILQEQHKSGKINLDHAAAIGELIIKVNSFNEKLENLKVIAPPINTKSFDEIFKKVISDMQITPNSEPKVVTRKFQILLFPEQDAKLFYKIVFGRWLLWLTVMLCITNLYKWSIHWSDNQKEIKLQNSETGRIKKAWNYLYFQEGKNIKRLMDSAYSRIVK